MNIIKSIKRAFSKTKVTHTRDIYYTFTNAPHVTIFDKDGDVLGALISHHVTSNNAKYVSIEFDKNPAGVTVFIHGDVGIERYKYDNNGAPENQNVCNK